MSEKLLVPDIGDFEEVEVIEVLAKEGDQLNINDPVITIESDKSSVEIPSTINGKVEKVEVKVGDKVSKGDLILNIASSGVNTKNNPIPKDTESIIKQACLIILSVSFGIGLFFVFTPEEAIFKIKSPFETLSPTFTSTFSTLPLMVEGISTLDLSLSIVITGSLIFN